MTAADGGTPRWPCCSAWIPDQLSTLPADHLATLDLSGLDAAEHRAAVAILRSLDHRVPTELRTDGAPNAASVNRLVEEPPPGPAGDEADTVAGIVARVREDVADVSRAGSLRALGRLARLLTPVPETAGPPRPPTPDAGTAAAPAGVGQPADPRVRLREAVGVMARDGTLGRLLEGVGDTRNDLPDDRRRLLDAIAALAGPAVDADGADSVAREAVELLSRNVTDWAVTDADAEAALPSCSASPGAARGCCAASTPTVTWTRSSTSCPRTSCTARTSAARPARS